jgi:hypothetical protein
VVAAERLKLHLGTKMPALAGFACDGVCTPWGSCSEGG